MTRKNPDLCATPTTDRVRTLIQQVAYVPGTYGGSESRNKDTSRSREGKEGLLCDPVSEIRINKYINTQVEGREKKKGEKHTRYQAHIIPGT